MLSIRLIYGKHVIWHYCSRMFYVLLYYTWSCDYNYDMWQFVTVTYDATRTLNSKSKIRK